jgi:CheY-like chemotaxis protein
LASVQATSLPLAEQHGVALVFASDTELPAFTVNRVALRQCLLNILAALIPAQAGGELEVAVTGCDGSVEIEVAAARPFQGPGRSASPDRAMDEALLETAAQLAALAGGRLEIQEREPDMAAMVMLGLPSADQVAVLAIDDNPDAIQMLQRFLTCSRYHLVAVQNPHEVLDQAVRTLPKVILLDVMLPEVDGWELLGRLRNHPLTAHIPVVLCSVLPQEQLALALGATAFLRKPLMPETVLATLDRLSR